MKRGLLLGVALVLAGPAAPQDVRLPVQRSPLAGYRYHEAPRLRAELVPGQPLELVREPGNPFDANAVRVDWRGRKLGYLPRSQNAAVAWALDAGEPIEARVAEPAPLRRTARKAPRRRIEIEVFVR